jgi:crotonobetainyl-CoA:carnitine CoA-transferase CaiB-like acyl-CoA transferase
MWSGVEKRLAVAAWTALRGDSGVEVGVFDEITIDGADDELVSPLPVREAAVAAVGVALLAASALQLQRRGRPPSVGLDRAHVAAAVRSERYFQRGGEPAGMGFAPLSRFWRTADGWVRTHANYRWHRTALIDAVGCGNDAAAVGAALAERTSVEIEEAVVARGGVAGAVRTLDAWRSHPHGRTLATEALVSHDTIGAAAPRVATFEGPPAGGIRVVDLTRVIAGPVCTRFLGALGAEVLRVDPPDLPDMASGATADTLLAKRSAFLDLRNVGARATLDALLGRADVVVCGYRSGALESFGLDEVALAERFPGLAIVCLNAWGHHGSWRQRRGFDSVVQAPTGIALASSSDGDEPGALPCQLLDHATGYLAAAAVLDSLRRQLADGGTNVRRLSLARTGRWLTDHASGTPEPPAAKDVAAGADTARWLVELDTAAGSVTAVRPPGNIDGRPLAWPNATGYGIDQPTWIDARQRS